MEYVTFNNGVKMPLVGFGTFRTKGEECRDAVLCAIRTGYRMIDTAQGYRNEEFVGEAIRTCGVPRDELFITTKVNYSSFENARAAVEESLVKLGSDYVDLVLLHWPFGNIYAAWRALEAMYKEGKIRAIGVSNFEPDRFIDLCAFNEIVPAVNQVEMNVLCQRKTEREWMAQYGIAPEAYAPLGQGKRDEMFALPAVAAAAQAHGKTPAQIILRYLVELGVAVIPKSTHPERIAENFALFDFALTEEEKAALAAADTATALVGNPERPETALRFVGKK